MICKQSVYLSDCIAWLVLSCLPSINNYRFSPQRAHTHSIQSNPTVDRLWKHTKTVYTNGKHIKIDENNGREKKNFETSWLLVVAGSQQVMLPSIACWDIVTVFYVYVRTTVYNNGFVSPILALTFALLLQNSFEKLIPKILFHKADIMRFSGHVYDYQMCKLLKSKLCN